MESEKDAATKTQQKLFAKEKKPEFKE